MITPARSPRHRPTRLRPWRRRSSIMTQRELQRMLAHETPLRGADAARGCGVKAGAITRWIRQGKPMPHGTRRRLEGYQAGRSWMTTIEALARFLASDPRQPGEQAAAAAKDSPERLAAIEYGRRRYAEALEKL